MIWRIGYLNGLSTVTTKDCVSETPNLTNLLQPLDVAVNRSYQEFYRSKYDAYIGRALQDPLLQTKAENPKTAEDVKKAFTLCGLVAKEEFEMDKLHAPLKGIQRTDFNINTWHLISDGATRELIDFLEMGRNPGRKTGDGARADEERLTAQADERDKWDRAQTAFEMLKNKIATAPVLRHLIQIGRTLKPNELNYGMVEKEILALLRILDVCYSTLVTRPIKVLTRHSTLAWLMRSTGLQGRLGNWAALLPPWALEIVKCTRGEDEILGTIAASIMPRESVDSILSSIARRKQPHQQIPA
ncbi:hypothetical protein F442_07739, partial [Phytophthora nicotianae P10297]